MTTCIYGLVDPNSGEIRYVGKTSVEPEKRLYQHLKASRHNTTGSHLLNWLNTLTRDGKKPSICILEYVSQDDDWREKERSWISYGRSSDWSLTNTTDGGEGLQNPSPSVRQKLSDAAKGKAYASGKRSAAFRQKMAHVAKNTKNAIGHTVSPAARARISQSLMGRTDHVPKGEANGRSVLTEDMVAEIRSKHSSGFSMRALGREYSVTHESIRKIVHGETWKHVGV